VSVGVLADVRVLDFGRYIAAPYCSLVLADLGAEVIRVEAPGGEADRRLGLRAAHGETFVFAGLARNKKGVSLDLRSGDGARAVLRDLLGVCDVVLHNFAPAAAAALGLGYERLRAIRPDVILAAISAYGSRGPDANRTGFDPVAQMASGAAAVTGDAESGPLRAGVPWVDYSTGLAAAAGILAAVRHRDRTGEGQAVECALLRTAVSYTAPIAAEATVGGQVRPRLGNQPAYIGVSNLFACADGHIYVVAVSPSTWRALARVIGHPELVDDPELSTPEGRFIARDRVDPLVEAWTRLRTVAAAAAVLSGERIPHAEYRTSAEVPGDPGVIANEMLAYVDLEHEGLSRVPATATPIALSRLSVPATSRPPRPGEHNAEVYGRLLGYSEHRMRELEDSGVI
jgi:crotonobetainyl-CoA:carnitine CoA-transferase CaiB-like acyl-CoA transferase